jgi:hypothetical protein
MSSIQNGSAGSTNGKTLLIAAVAAVSESQQQERFAIASFDVTTVSAKASSGATTNGRDLDPNPRSGVPPFLMLRDDVALLSKILLGHGTWKHFQ